MSGVKTLPLAATSALKFPTRTSHCQKDNASVDGGAESVGVEFFGEFATNIAGRW